MDKPRHCQLLLDRLTTVLQTHEHWDVERPPVEALNSNQPFAIDTLRCEQWLQWIFIPKLNHMLAMKMALPAAFEISPYVEEAMKEAKGYRAILAVTRELDQLFKSE
ncbi:YqcC family protein [Photobacterium sp. DNB23_23_1]|uniref:YqcC family protein n=1 Tax=Photobacterium pectinilyticum TaxID=2906793 RepID=A0ABT1N1A7_9GAMM|nr:YqcC family protein [Photobacterium sp. ZSDE20]MCQ1058522.1 YqcC family protein [Photobacterium sp. ZSDE20]MDD1823253.1 YqcC family protein [Photobacterium sp. ZSDE20]